MKKTVGDLYGYELDSAQTNFVRFSALGEGGKIHISAYSPTIIKIEYEFEGIETAPEFEKAASFITSGYVSTSMAPKVFVEEKELDYSITIGDGKLPPAVVRVEKKHGTQSIYQGDILVHGGRLGTHDTVIPSYPVRCLSEGRGAVPLARFNFPLAAEDAFYGLGDKAGPPNRRGLRFKFFNRDALGYDAEKSDPLYKSIPFFIKRNRASEACCGIFFPSVWIEDMDFGRESPYYFKVDLRGGPFSYFVLLGPAYHDILEAYARITGFPALPPLFSFGFLGSSMNYVEGDDAAGKIKGYFARVEEEGIPCEGMYVSSGYLKAQDGKRYAFLWNKKKFPDYRAFLKELSERGYNLCMNIKPGILSSHPWYEKIASEGFLIKNAEGKPFKEFFWGGEASFIDFDNASATEWWKSQLREQYLEHGCTGIWNDNNELELEEPELPAYRTKQLYPVKMAKAAYEVFKENNPETRPWIYSRSGYSGLQRYARTWTGDNCSDWKTLQFNQYMGLSLGLSGLPFYGHDLGGFFGNPPSEELLARSCQSAVFQPRFVIHSWREDGNPTEPWTYPRIKHQIRDYILEHYRFMPYTYNCAIEASLRGIPIERPLFLEYPEDNHLNELDPHYLFGPSILKVLVVREGVLSTTVRFPSSDSWYDPIEHTVYRNGGASQVSVPFEGSRWFAKTGSVIPTSPGLIKLNTAYFALVDFMIFPPDKSEEKTFVYYEDDGKTEWNLGRYNKWTIRLSYDNDTHRGSLEILEEHHGGMDKDPGRVFRFSLPDFFQFAGSNPAEIKVAQLRREGKRSWDFNGSYR